MAERLSAQRIVDGAVKSLKRRVERLKHSGWTPTLKVILVGGHPPSLIYTQNKKNSVKKLVRSARSSAWGTRSIRKHCCQR